jgi:hypothetical protein
MGGARLLLRWEGERGLIRFQERSEDARLYENNATLASFPSCHDRTPSPGAHECKAIEMRFGGRCECMLAAAQALSECDRDWIIHGPAFHHG